MCCLSVFILFILCSKFYLEKVLEKKTEKEIKKRKRKPKPTPLTPRATQFSNRPSRPAQRPLLPFLSGSRAPSLSLSGARAPPVSAASPSPSLFVTERDTREKMKSAISSLLHKAKLYKVPKHREGPLWHPRSSIRALAAVFYAFWISPNTFTATRSLCLSSVRDNPLGELATCSSTPSCSWFLFWCSEARNRRAPASSAAAAMAPPRRLSRPAGRRPRQRPGASRDRARNKTYLFAAVLLKSPWTFPGINPRSMA